MEKNKVPCPVLHMFRVKSSLSTTTQYDLVESIGGETLLTEHLTISINRGLTAESTDYWLSPKPIGDWPQLTWLYRTFLDTLFVGYRGDANGKEDTLLVHINDEMNKAEVYYFKDYYTKKIGPLLQAIEQCKLKP